MNPSDDQRFLLFQFSGCFSPSLYAAGITVAGLDSTFSVVVSSGVNLSTDILSFAAGEMAALYFTLTPFKINNLPTWQVMKQVVEDGGAQS